VSFIKQATPLSKYGKWIAPLTSTLIAYIRYFCQVICVQHQ